MPIEFREVLRFSKQRRECFVDDADFEQFCKELADAPTSGDEVPQAGGARKIRYADKKRGKGKSGGLRIYYYYYEEADTIYLLAVYNKNTVHLSPVERREVAAAISVAIAPAELEL